MVPCPRCRGAGKVGQVRSCVGIRAGFARGFHERVFPRSTEGQPGSCLNTARHGPMPICLSHIHAVRNSTYPVISLRGKPPCDGP